MDPELKHRYEYTNLKEWVHYATIFMKKISAQLHEEGGTEIWLVAKRGVIGKWCDDKNYGYIEEYRSKIRLLEESNSD